MGMGTSFLMTIGALLLLGIFTLTANGLIAQNERIAEENEYTLTSLSIAQSIIDEAKSKAFDQTTLSAPLDSALTLTLPDNLGPEPGESVPSPDSLSAEEYLSRSTFNDVDDYNGYVRVVNTPRASGYTVSVSVMYASPSWPDSNLTTMSFCKRMSVTVTSPHVSQPVSLHYAFIY